jgi:hypothetical protein
MNQYDYVKFSSFGNKPRKIEIKFFLRYFTTFCYAVIVFIVFYYHKQFIH